MRARLERGSLGQCA